MMIVQVPQAAKKATLYAIGTLRFEEVVRDWCDSEGVYNKDTVTAIVNQANKLFDNIKNKIK